MQIPMNGGESGGESGNARPHVSQSTHAVLTSGSDEGRPAFRRAGVLTDLRSYPAWAQEMMEATQPARAAVVGHPLFDMMAQARLPHALARNFLLSVWPVIEQFPQYMAVNLCKVRFGRTAGDDLARQFLLHNIRVEQNHADHWIAWAQSCGISKIELVFSDTPAQSLALAHWCWHCCEHESLAVGIAATNLAIEGATGEWSARVCGPGLYEASFAPAERLRAMRWLKLHAHYDDTHPWEALDIVCTLLGHHADAAQLATVQRAIVRSYEYMTMLLDFCLEPGPGGHA